MIITDLREQGLINPPKWLENNCVFLAVTGSVAYGMSTDTSDEDIVGFVIPPRKMLFPWEAGEIPDFGNQKERFRVWQQHHIKVPGTAKQYDFTVYSITHFFQLAMNANPNIVSMLFSPIRCIKHSTDIGEKVREHRKLFLHKGAWHKFKGYAYSSLNKVRNKKLTIFVSFCRQRNVSTDITLEEVNEEIKRREANQG